ncbi:GAF domain-containing protein [bacterium]|nr:GAF domain-containing protein [bacterium]
MTVSFDNDIKTVLNNIQNATFDLSLLKDNETNSCILTLTAYAQYMQDKKNYLNSLKILKDAKYLAELQKDFDAKLLWEYVFAKIAKTEKNDKEAMSHFKNAERLAYEKDTFGILPDINEEIKMLDEKTNDSLKKGSLVALLKIGHEIAAETDIDVLLRVIAQETRIALKADRCTVFLYDKDKDELWSKIALGLDSQEIRFPASKGLAGHVVKTGQTINIRDAYADSRFNPEIDKQTGYKTKTILCMPIKNHNQEIIGAFQVLNKFDGVFNDDDEELLVAIGSSAGISIVNAQLFQRQQQMLEEQKQIFDSFIDTLATSIDAKDSITAGHSSRVRMYSGLIAEQMGLSLKEKEIIETAATLHDIGKIGIRDSVLQKEGKLTDEEYAHIQKHVEITHNILQKIHMSEDFKLVTEIACSHHEKFNGMGYYRKIAGTNIPLGGRILAIADVFDAITSKRHYRDKMPMVNVLKIFVTDNNSHFDKSIVDEFLAIPTDKIVGVFLTENHLQLNDDDRKILNSYSMQNLYDILNKESLSDEETKFVEMFQHYYTAKTKEDV